MQVKLSVFWDYAKAMGLYSTVAICLLYPGQSAASIGANVWLSAWTNEAMTESQQNNTSMRLGVYAALGILQGERQTLLEGVFLPSGLLDPPNHTLAPVSSSTITAIALPRCLPNPPGSPPASGRLEFIPAALCL